MTAEVLNLITKLPTRKETRRSPILPEKADVYDLTAYRRRKGVSRNERNNPRR